MIEIILPSNFCLLLFESAAFTVLVQSQMAHFLLVIFVFLSSTSGSHVHKGDELDEGSPSKKVLVYFADLVLFTDFSKHKVIVAFLV